ncbi:MAG: hypothetical protein MJ094_05400 [Saccharofermentans sp.]|nr:hypothetical protein [Saccharofermentans sp.]
MNMKKSVSTIYLIVFLLILMIPSAGILIWGPSEPENDDAAQAPQYVLEEGGYNHNYLSDLGNYFESRFALRPQMVTLYSEILGHVFGTSSQVGVVVGENGWLYYTDTLGDFQGTNCLNVRQMNNCVRNIELINEYCENNGIEFLFVIAPNKNSLYPENMPYYTARGVGGQANYNRSQLVAALANTNVDYIDLYEPLSSYDGVVYFERDSHWNNLGAAIAADSIFDFLGINHTDYINMPYSLEINHRGDLEQMVYPELVREEEDVVFESMPAFNYDSPVESNFDFRIGTNANGTGSLLMYRDSFGSGILPFMAECFETAFFTRSNACQITDMMSINPDYVVFERAERFLPFFCQYPSRLPAPDRVLPEEAVQIEVSDLNIAEAGDYITVTGTLPDGSYNNDSTIYIIAGDLCFEASPVSNLSNGLESFSALLEKNRVSDDNIMLFIA